MPEAVTRVAVVQQSGRSADLARNLSSLLAAIDAAGARGADLVVATELCLTPYFAASRSPRRHWAVEPDGGELRQIAAAAARNALTVVAPVYLKTRPDGGDNAAVVLGPDGSAIDGTALGGDCLPHYTKVHLPQARPAGSGIDEPRHFRPGRRLPVFDTPAGRIGVLLCYDRRFPEAWRTLALAGADLVVVPSCIPLWNPAEESSSRDLFVAELQTRATENPLFVAAASRAGDESLEGRTITFIGRSCVVAPGGTVLAEAGAEGDELLISDLDLSLVGAVRSRLTVLDDRQPHAYALCPPAPEAERT